MALHDHRDLYRRTKKYLEDIVINWNERQRRAYIGDIFRGCVVEGRLTPYYGDEPVIFVDNLLIVLENTVPCIENEPLIITLFNGLKEGGYFGYEKQQTHSALLSEIKRAYQMATTLDTPVQGMTMPEQQPPDSSPATPQQTDQEHSSESKEEKTAADSDEGDDEGDMPETPHNNEQESTGGNNEGRSSIRNLIARIQGWWEKLPQEYKWALKVLGGVGVFIVGLSTVAACAYTVGLPQLLTSIPANTNTPEHIATTESTEEAPLIVVTNEPTEAVIEAPLATQTSSITPISTTDTPIPFTPEAPITMDTPVPFDNAERSLPLTLYVSAGQLVIHIADNPSGVSLEQLKFIDSNKQVHPLRDYGSFNTYFMVINTNERSICLVIYDPTIQNITPQECRDNDVQQFRQTIASVDNWWWLVGDGLQPFIVTNDAGYAEICSDSSCSIDYIEP